MMMMEQDEQDEKTKEKKEKNRQACPTENSLRGAECNATTA